MPGFTPGKVEGKKNFSVKRRPIGKSVDLILGDIVVLTTVSAKTTSAMPVLRPLLAADIAALYQDGSGNVCGIFGVATHTHSTNSSGIVATQPSVTNVAASARPIYALPGVSAGYEVDATNGFSLDTPVIADDQTLFYARLLTGSASNILTGTQAGIDLTSGVYTVNTSATTKIFTIEGYDPQDPFDTAVYVRVLPAFQQYSTGFPYTAQ